MRLAPRAACALLACLVAACPDSAPSGSAPAAPPPSAKDAAAPAPPKPSATPSANAPPAPPAADAAPPATCTIDVPAAVHAIKDVPSKLLAEAIVPSLDPATMRAKVTKTKGGALVLSDCHGGTAPAAWEDGPDGKGLTPPGTVKVIGRKALPGGQEAVWLASTIQVGACVAPDGFGLLAIVALEDAHARVLGVGPWDPSCHDKRALRVEKLGDVTVYVEPDGFGTGAGVEEWETVRVIADGELRVAGRYDTRLDGGEATQVGQDDAGVFWPPYAEAKAKFVGSEIVVSGLTKWIRLITHDGSTEYSPARTEAWVERYALVGKKLVMKPVPKGKPRRPAAP